MNYKRIIVAVDGSDTSYSAFLEALNFAKLLKAKLCIVNVVDAFPISNLAMGVDFDKYREIMRTDAQSILAHMKDFAKNGNVDAETQITEIIDSTKKVSEKIIEITETWRADLIVIGSHGKRGVRRFLLGSVAEETMRIAAVPVLLIRTQNNSAKNKITNYKHILSAIDGTEASNLVITDASDLATSLNAKLTILYVADEFPSKNFIFPNEVAIYKDTAKKIGRGILEEAHEFARSMNVSSEEILIESTDPTQTIAQHHEYRRQAGQVLVLI